MPQEHLGSNMGQPATVNALKRKTSVGQRAREVQGLTPTRAIRIALARAAGELWELPLSVTALRHDLAGIEDLLDWFEDTSMLLLLDGPDGVRGGMTLDRALITSGTEVQTIGEVSERPPGSRPFTPTDAAMVAPLVDDMLERMDVALSGTEEDAAAFERREVAWALGYRFGAKVDRKRSLLLALEGEEFHVIRLDIDIAAGMREGTMVLCLPVCEEPEPPPDPDPVHIPGAHADDLASVPIKLSATLPRFDLPLSTATALKVGDILPMTQDALSSVALRASDGQTMARCTLGKMGDMRALRVQPRRGQTAAHTPSAHDEEGFAIGALSHQDGEAAAERSVAPPQAAPPQTAAAPTKKADQDEVLPDLPPLDFDTTSSEPSDAPPLDVGNANFE